jgi:hypothetical protein
VPVVAQQSALSMGDLRAACSTAFAADVKRLTNTAGFELTDTGAILQGACTEIHIDLGGPAGGKSVVITELARSS